jgi:DNA-binding response OmpR family regulator
MPEQWPRALLRSALREAGYDAVGTRNLSSAQRIPATTPGRGPVRLVVLDQGAMDGAGQELLSRLLAAHGRPATLLIARSTSATPTGAQWRRVLHRPVSVADIAGTVQSLLPLPAEQQHPID